jgi:hypothetical protein
MGRVSRNASIPYARSGQALSWLPRVWDNPTDRSKILFLLIQYLRGIKWSFGICAISSPLERSSISDERPSASMFLNDARRILQDVEEAKRRAEWVAVGRPPGSELSVSGCSPFRHLPPL